jgi:hypothetical protein
MPPLVATFPLRDQMTWLNFIAVSKWPALIALGGALFRRQIGALISRVAGGSKMSMPQVPKASPLIEEAEEIAIDRLETTSNPHSDAAGDPWIIMIDHAIKRLANSDEFPSEYCLLRSWGTVERLARSNAEGLVKAQVGKHLTLAELTATLELGGSAKALVGRLRDIRNKVADGELAVSPTDALRYRDLVVALLHANRNHLTARNAVIANLADAE